MTEQDKPRCMECGSAATLTTGAVIYPHRRDLHAKPFWQCRCGAYCGCHPGTTQPLGNPCGPETRAARSAAHAAFDPLWKRKVAKEGCSKGKARGKGYKWLADQLGIDPKDCHIGMMDASTARRVVAIVRCAQSPKGPTT